MTTVREAAAALGLKENDYDTALPQTWVNDFADNAAVKKLAAALGVDSYPAGQFVWSYAKAHNFGEPVALTPEAAQLLAVYEGRV